MTPQKNARHPLRLRIGSESLRWSPDRNTIRSPTTKRGVSPSEQSIVDSSYSNSPYTLFSINEPSVEHTPLPDPDRPTYVAHSSATMCQPQPWRAGPPPLGCDQSRGPETAGNIMQEKHVRMFDASPKKRGTPDDRSSVSASPEYFLDHDVVGAQPPKTPTKISSDAPEPCLRSDRHDEACPKHETGLDWNDMQQQMTKDGVELSSLPECLASPLEEKEEAPIPATPSSSPMDKGSDRELPSPMTGRWGLASSPSMPLSTEPLPKPPNFQRLVELLAEDDPPTDQLREVGRGPVGDDGDGIGQYWKRKHVAHRGDAIDAGSWTWTKDKAELVGSCSARDNEDEAFDQGSAGTRVVGPRASSVTSGGCDADASHQDEDVPLPEGFVEAKKNTPRQETRPGWVSRGSFDACAPVELDGGMHEDGGLAMVGQARAARQRRRQGPKFQQPRAFVGRLAGGGGGGHGGASARMGTRVVGGADGGGGGGDNDNYDDDQGGQDATEPCQQRPVLQRQRLGTMAVGVEGSAEAYDPISSDAE